METVKVKPWGEGQGEFVVINAADFDPSIYTLYIEPHSATDDPSEMTKAQIVEGLKALSVQFSTQSPKAELMALYFDAREIHEA